jgi:hypothetical protein
MTDLPATERPNSRRTVIFHVLAGTILGWLLFALLFGLVLGPIAATKADRLAYAAAWLLPLAIVIFLMSAATGLGRFFGGGTDPTLSTDSRYVDISRRVLTNTIEQSLVFALAALAMAALTPAGQLGLLGSLVILFVIARIVFWIGYLIDPLYREAGFALTAEINVVIIVWDLVHLV